MDFSVVTDNLHLYARGTLVTLQVLFTSIPIGTCIGILGAVALLNANPLLRMPTQAVVTFFRGTPLLIQLFLIYYGLGAV